MLVQLNSVVIDADPGNRQEMASFLASYGVQVIAQLQNVEQLPAILAREEGLQVAVVNLDPAPHDNLKKVGALVRQHPAVSFFVLSQVMDPTLLMEAIHSGVREFVQLPIDASKFSAGIERCAQVHGMGKKARIIHMVPTVGGCGSTSVACNIAASLARTSKAVLVDLDLVRGAVASSFDLRPRYTIADLMESAEKLDNQMLDNALAIHQNSKLAILARPDLPEDTQRVSGPGLVRLTNVLGRMFDYVVLDSLMSIDPLYASAIQTADLNVIVMQLNVPSAKNAERFVGSLRRMGVEASKIRIVVNRFVKKGSDIEPDEIERAMGLKISWMIPNDFKNAIASINFGEPVVLRAPKSEISTSLVGLSASLMNTAKAVAA